MSEMTGNFDGLTRSAAQRISRTVIEWERSDARTSDVPRRQRRMPGPIPNWDAIANENISAGTYGEVELLSTDRATRSGQTVQAYSANGANTDDIFIILPVAMIDAPETDVRWYIVAPGGDTDVVCGQPGQPCANMQPNTEPLKWTLFFDPDQFEPWEFGDPDDDYGWLTNADGHEIEQRSNDPCVWIYDGRWRGETTLQRFEQTSANVSSSIGFTVTSGYTGAPGSVYTLTGFGPSAPVDGSQTQNIQYSAYTGVPPNGGFVVKSTVQVGDVIGTAVPNASTRIRSVLMCCRVWRPSKNF